MVLKQVVKNKGHKESFSPEKLKKSIETASSNVKLQDDQVVELLCTTIINLIDETYTHIDTISTIEIGDLVEKVLVEHGHAKIAQEFIRYRENKKHLRKDINSLGVKDDIGLSYNTLYILKQRYLRRNEKGETIETPFQMLERVAKFVASVEKTKRQKDHWYREFLGIMKSFEFLPGTRTLTNSGKKAAQLANCFVWPMYDDVDKIFEILHKSTVIKKNGGGCGYNFSSVRPEGDLVGGIPGLAAGPVKMIEMFDLMTSLFRQEGKYESGNMAVLNANHADIFNFITAKQTDGYLPKTNISVGITDDFMKAAIANKNWKLINPRTGKVVNTVKARAVLNLMASLAWQTGDPGIINLSAINKGTALANPLLQKRGPITATNPCGEEPLFPFESCNLGYINFVKFIEGDKFNFKKLAEVMKTATRFMDNVIDASWFPVKEVTEAVRNHRRIGIGAVGWAEVLSHLAIPYDSNEAILLAEKVTKTMYQSAFEASCDLAEEKGPFPYVKDSIWANKKRKPRNVALLTFPPSSGNAVICETSFGIEPYFALAYEQNVLGGMRLTTVVPAFVEALKKRGLYSEDLIQKIVDNHGSVQGIADVPKDIQDIFKVAHDVHWKDHIKMQASFQKWTDNAITKTINMPTDTTPNDIEEAYILAWKLGCKGLTVYRDKTKSEQVFTFGKEKTEMTKKCPTCEIPLVKDKKCYKCKQCGFSTCEL